jgi:hypothetical protein
VGLDTALLLVGFGVTKLGIAATILWLGLRSGERPDDDDDFRGPAPDEPLPPPPALRARRRASVRAGPVRSPAAARPRRARA